MNAMSWKNYFVYQADYQHWANEVLFTSLDHMGEASRQSPQGLFFESIHRTLGHMLVDSRNWTDRLKHENASLSYDGMPQHDWKELKNMLRHDVRNLQRWMAAQPESFFEERLTYTGSNSQLRANWVRDILTHMMTHMAHHRGQISAVATRLGAPVPEMDYLFYKREMDEHVEHIKHAPEL